MLEAGTVVADRFRLLRELGMGGMGAVWLAQHTGLDVPCAIKFIHAHAAASAEIRGRFEREAKAAAALRSPHVVGILDHGVWGSTPYIAMEYLEGEDLERRFTRQGRLSAVELVRVISQVCRALAKAHALGLVHRDIKPANIFLARDDDREIAKVLDFGIAKSNMAALGDSGTKTGSLLGTPFYMSPEQAQGTRAVDHRSDLWALGVVVFQGLTGRLPFQAEAFGDLLMKIMMEAPPVPSQLAPLPPSFDAWWARAASRDPAGRFQNAKEFAETLALSLGVTLGGPTSAHAPHEPWTFDPMLAPQSSWTPLGQSSPELGRSSPPAFSAVGPLGPAHRTASSPGATATLAGTASSARKGAKGAAAIAVVSVLVALFGVGAVVFAMRGRPAATSASSGAPGPVTAPPATHGEPARASAAAPASPPAATSAPEAAAPAPTSEPTSSSPPADTEAAPPPTVVPVKRPAGAPAAPKAPKPAKGNGSATDYGI
jgi:serine/threonine protein kinase